MDVTEIRINGFLSDEQKELIYEAIDRLLAGSASYRLGGLPTTPPSLSSDDWAHLERHLEECIAGQRGELRVSICEAIRHDIRRFAREEAKHFNRREVEQQVRQVCTELADKHIIEAVARLEQKYGKVREAALEVLRGEVRRVVEEAGRPFVGGEDVRHHTAEYSLQQIGWPDEARKDDED